MYDDPTVRARVPASDPGEPTRTMQADAEAVDAPMPPGPETDEPAAAWRRPAAVIAAFAAVLVGVAAGLAFTDDSGSNPTAAPTTSLRGTSLPTTSLSNTASTLVGSTLRSLLVALEDDPDDFGTRGGDLRDRLARLVDRRAITADESARVLSEIAVWVQRRELDPAVGAVASRLVAAIPTVSVPASTDDGRGDDNRGPGDGDGDEDDDE